MIVSDSLIISAIIIGGIAGVVFGIMRLIESGVKRIDDYEDWNDHI